jgi:hypothetical protein
MVRPFKKLPKKLPKFLHQYFWDIDLDKIDASEDSYYVAERIMDWGDLKVFKWLKDHFRKEYLRQIAIESRQLSKFNKIFWLNYLNIYPKKTLCSQKELLKKPQTVWPY